VHKVFLTRLSALMNPLTKFNTVFKTNKPVIAMAHLLPLPGSPLYDAERRVKGIITEVRRDVEAHGGVDAISKPGSRIQARLCERRIRASKGGRAA
jgi:hypothetical protein